METIKVKREDIVTNGGTQVRFQLSEEAIERYAEALKEGQEFPPLEVVYDGARYWLWDGLHRINAGDTIEKTVWDVHVTQGTQQDAIWLSYSANGYHGLPRTRTEIERAVIAALQHPKGRALSDELIARHTKTTKNQVKYIRRTMSGERTPEESTEPPVTERLGVDGKMRKVPPKAETTITAPAPATPPPLVDQAKRPIDKSDYYNLVTGREVVSALRQRLIEAKQAWERVTKAIDTDSKAAQFAKHPAYKTAHKITSSLPSAIIDLWNALPYTSCPYCKGEGQCEVCNGSRWVTEQQFEDCPDPVKAVTGPTFAQFKNKKAA